MHIEGMSLKCHHPKPQNSDLKKTNNRSYGNNLPATSKDTAYTFQVSMVI